eukprot:TRINITY_DN10250_c0_g1_i2.p1 TRINITY_DN10250_c0_g1~~TRINITY_DN10250_c0_g1_i2.p1  ORF type:complete len:503 (-),score=102.44 TRINITY_DN10250_c0_g1_i2:57-1469(-)
MYTTAYDPRSAIDYMCEVEGLQGWSVPNAVAAAPLAKRAADLEHLLRDGDKAFKISATCTPCLMVQVCRRTRQMEGLLGTCKVSISEVLSNAGERKTYWSRLLRDNAQVGEVKVCVTFHRQVDLDRAARGAGVQRSRLRTMSNSRASLKYTAGGSSHDSGKPQALCKARVTMEDPQVALLDQCAPDATTIDSEQKLKSQPMATQPQPRPADLDCNGSSQHDQGSKHTQQHPVAETQLSVKGARMERRSTAELEAIVTGRMGQVLAEERLVRQRAEAEVAELQATLTAHAQSAARTEAEVTILRKALEEMRASAVQPQHKSTNQDSALEAKQGRMVTPEGDDHSASSKGVNRTPERPKEGRKGRHRDLHAMKLPGQPEAPGIGSNDRVASKTLPATAQQLQAMRHDKRGTDGHAATTGTAGMRLALPAGWARAYTGSGREYFIDHNTRTTSWTHPLLATPAMPAVDMKRSA